MRIGIICRFMCFFSFQAKGSGCGFFEWIHEGQASSWSDMQIPTVNTVPTRMTKNVMRHLLEMEFHASNRVFEFAAIFWSN